jgi:hypothetical protein
MTQSPLKVYGLSDTDLEVLRQISQQRYGKANVSLLARDLLLAESTKDSLESESQISGNNDNGKERRELRLPRRLDDYLARCAKTGKMSVNRYAISILMGYMEQHPTLTDDEVRALYQSNYQLVKIGNNLNQIARKLNAGETVSLTSQSIADLVAFIDAHTDKVGELIRQHRKRTQR